MKLACKNDAIERTLIVVQATASFVVVAFFVLRFAVIGLGRFGRKLAISLTARDVEVVAINRFAAAPEV